MAAKVLFVTATGTGVGKTYAATRLIAYVAQRGLRVAAAKPIETGVTDIGEDASALARALHAARSPLAPDHPHTLTCYTFALPAAPFCADKDGTIDPEVIAAHVRQLAHAADVVIVEGAGGLFVPITQDFFMIDLAQMLHARVILITPSRLGCINDTLLSLQALRARNITHRWCVNLYEDRDTFDTVSAPFYDAAFDSWQTLEEMLGDDALMRFITP